MKITIKNECSEAWIAKLCDVNPGWIHLSGAFDSLYRQQTGGARPLSPCPMGVY